MSISTPPSTNMQGSRVAQEMAPYGLEGRLFAVISPTKWQSIDDILSRARINDEFERNLATIKLKQLVASGMLLSEVINMKSFFLQATK